MEDNSTSDEELIQRYLGNDLSGFDALYGRYKNQLYAYLNRLMPGSPDLADDMFQQTWVKVIDTLPRYRHQGKFLAWLFRIAHNVSMDHFRKGKRNAASLDEDDAPEVGDDAPVPWENVERRELETLLADALADLPPEQREVFLLRQDGVAFKEIAEIQGASINTALGRMQYALKNLKKKFEAMGIGKDDTP